MRMVGIVTAMRVEASCLTRADLPFNEMTSLGERAAIWLSGMGEKAARGAAEGLQQGGCTTLVSFGLAGALDSSLRPGDLVLPDSIHAGRQLSVDLDWRNRLRQQLPAHMKIASGILAASPNVLTSADAKRELAEATGACAVDMESGAVAQVAARAGIPFLAVRVIADPLDFSPPLPLLSAVRPDGSADPVRLMALILRRSVTLGTLLRLGSQLRTARATLLTVVKHAGTELGTYSK
ncbi:MAG: phosphorylase [Nitrosospira sp.]|nr:phosphorylase [Nitrosospira sp.]